MCVDCESSTTSTTEVSTSYKDGDVRLTNGKNEYEGYVQMYSESDGTWGNICHNKWQTPEAIVVCKQLGFSPIGNVNSCTWPGNCFTKSFFFLILKVRRQLVALSLGNHL